MASSSEPRVVVELEGRRIVLEVLESRAPRAAAYFLGLVESGAYDGASIYRSTTLGVTGGPRLVQAGPLGSVLAPDPRSPAATAKSPKLLKSFETTAESRLTHTNGTLSLARDLLDTGHVISEFFICLGPFPQLDAGGRREPDERGFPAIGRVLAGLEGVAEIAGGVTGGRTPVARLEGEILSEQPRIDRMTLHRPGIVSGDRG